MSGTPSFSRRSPLTECLKDVVVRLIPSSKETIMPPTCEPARQCLWPHTVTRCAPWSSTSTSISDEDIAGLDIPTGNPLRYDLDENLKPSFNPGGTYLDPEAAAAGAAAVAAQGAK